MNKVRITQGTAVSTMKGTEGYGAEAATLFERYERFNFSQSLGAMMPLFPIAPTTVIDIGAGTGRDAAHMASLGHRVLAVEPTPELRERAKLIRPSKNLQWLDDGLPELTKVLKLQETYAVVLLNAVWMHLNEAERAVAMRNIALLSQAGTRVFISLRHGPVPKGRRMFEVSGNETIELGRQNGFKTLFNAKGPSINKENMAAGVSWTRLVLEHA